MDGKFVSINLDGKRWKNEVGFGESLANQPGAVAYSVADNEIVETVGSDMASGKNLDSMMAMFMKDPNSNESKAIKKWREDLEYEAAIDDEGAHGHHVKKANTLVELALKMEIDPGEFVDTIERYNKFCETGKDLDFNKDAKFLKPIRKPPFYAIYGHRFSQCTKGLNGVAVNTDFEVLNPKGEIIPGLYAAGDTCTIYGDLVLGPPMGPPGGGGENQNKSSTAQDGGNILSGDRAPCQGAMAAFMSGYAAGTHVAEYLKNN